MLKVPSLKDIRPYYPKLNKTTKSDRSSILWHQLEYWFWVVWETKKKKNFYKFIEPPKKNRGDYKIGDSWSEELGFTKRIYRNAFDKIGVRWESSTHLKLAIEEYGEDIKFNNRMYCSVYSKANKKNFYYRNEQLVNNLIKENEYEVYFDFDKKILKELSKE